MTRKSKLVRASGQTLLLVDDNLEYVEATRLLLEREGHRVLCASNGPEALNLLRQNPVDLMLLDYFMPGMTGEEVVSQLRQFNPYVQVILQTGYASEQPPRELLSRLDIQGYHDKSEGPDKLLMWVDVGLKAAYTVQLLYKSRQGLRYILDVTPDLHKIQPLDDLLQGILWQVSGLLGAVNSFLAVLPQGDPSQTPPESPEGFLAMMEEDAGLIIRASTGRFSGKHLIDGCLEPSQVIAVRETLQQGKIHETENSTIVPLHVGGMTIGVVYLDRLSGLARDIELLQIFANQAAVAIHNAQLYEMATLDPLTGVYVRRFFDQWLVRELRSAFRTRQDLSLLMMDIDTMKHINDLGGHLAGDQALALVGKALRQSTRGSDIVSRYGGDEFTVILPQTPVEGADRVGRRFLESLQDKNVSGQNLHLPLAVSIGLSVLEAATFPANEIPRPVPQSYFQEMAKFLLQKADETLYRAKRDGGNRLYCGPTVQWQPIVTEATGQEALMGDENAMDQDMSQA